MRRHWVPVQLDHETQVTRFYARYADQLRRAIRRKTCGLDDALVDDACAFAWEQLLRRPYIDLQHHSAYSWVYKVALRRAWRLARLERRLAPAGGLTGLDEDGPEPAGSDIDLVDLVADRVEQATLREMLRDLHWRERRELLLYAHGLSYEEIAAVTGTSYTAVNRWLARGKKALRDARTRRNAGWTPER
jgi:RNA polymerase sigma factor (sigma-70 family)